MPTIDQVAQGIIAAERQGDTNTARKLAEVWTILKRQPQPETPGIGKSLGRGAIGGSLGLLDLGTQVAGYPARKLYEAAGGTVPDFLQPSNAAQVAQEYTGTDQPPVTAGERAAELLGSSLAPGGAAVGLAAKAGRFIPALAIEAGSLGGSMLGRETGVAIGGPGSIPEAVGTLAGGIAAPLGAGTVTRALSGASPKYSTQAVQQQTLDAFERQGVPPNLGVIADDSFVQKAAKVVPGGYGVARRTAQSQADAMETSLKKLAPKGDEVTAGKRVLEGIDYHIEKKFKPTAKKLYALVDKRIPPDTPVDVTHIQNLFRKFDDEVGIFPQSLGNASIRKMQAELQTAIEEGKGLDYRTLAKIRSSFGQKLATVDLVSEIPRTYYKQLYGAATKDLTVAAKLAGKDAEMAQRRASNYWKKGIKVVDDFLEPLAKKTTPEETFRAVSRAVGEKGSPTRTKYISKTLKPKQREVILSTMLHKLGDPTPGMRSPDWTFSPSTFLTNLNKIDDKSFAMMAKGTKYEGSQHLKDLRLVAGRLRDVDKFLNNPSGTASALMNAAPIAAGGGSLAFGIDIAAKTLAGIASAAGTGFGAAKLVTNPTFVKWVVSGTKVRPEHYPAHLARLATAMQNEPDEDKQAVGEFIKQSMGEQ